MTERLLQFIWQFQYFNKNELVAANGEAVQVIHPGIHNSNQGPDFSNAKILVDHTTWAGTVELHLKTSDWYRHGHQDDKNYANVVLHVVWEHDKNNDGIQQSIPIIELRSRVAKILLQRYEDLMNSTAFVPCENSIATIKDITWKSWKERLLAERLLRKAGIAETFLQQNNFHWEETFWWLLARNFGMKVNADAFEAMARSISINILAKHKSQIHQLEALLLGQAGLLDDDLKEDYPVMLKKEYVFYKTKYKLRQASIQPFFLRMRPGNFPTIRLAQLAMLVHNSAHLFSRIKEANAASEIRKWFDITANDYWHYHYRFDEESSFRKKNLGTAMIDNILINTVCTVLFAYGHLHREQKYKDKALQWLEEITGESNSITKGFSQVGMQSKNARDSQALIELKNSYCSSKRCLDCAIGNVILKN